MEATCDILSRDCSNMFDNSVLDDQTPKDQSNSANCSNLNFYEDLLLDDFVSFSDKTDRNSPIHESISDEQNKTETTNDDKIAEEKTTEKFRHEENSIFPETLSQNIGEIKEKLRHERRQEFAPIYKPENTEEIQKRPLRRKNFPKFSMKRIRPNEQTTNPTVYGSYGPVHAGQHESYSNFPGSMPWPQFYPPVHSAPHLLPSTTIRMTNQRDMIQLERLKQEHSGFWPESQQGTINNEFHSNFHFHNQAKTNNSFQNQPINNNIPFVDPSRQIHRFPQASAPNQRYPY